MNKDKIKETICNWLDDKLEGRDQWDVLVKLPDYLTKDTDAILKLRYKNETEPEYIPYTYEDDILG